jgi:hypothetical protein
MEAAKGNNFPEKGWTIENGALSVVDAAGRNHQWW